MTVIGSYFGTFCHFARIYWSFLVHSNPIRILAFNLSVLQNTIHLREDIFFHRIGSKSKEMRPNNMALVTFCSHTLIMKICVTQIMTQNTKGVNQIFMDFSIKEVLPFGMFHIFFVKHVFGNYIKYSFFSIFFAAK